MVNVCTMGKVEDFHIDVANYHWPYVGVKYKRDRISCQSNILDPHVRRFITLSILMSYIVICSMCIDIAYPQWHTNIKKL